MAARLDIVPQILRRSTDTIECWDDDPDFAELEHIQQPPLSPASSRAGTDYARRDSTSAVSSRRSTITSIYDLDALEVAEREHQIPFDESPAAAIKSAQSAGIPIPENTPFSALVGGTIKRLGQIKRPKIAMHDDWGEDLEFPTMGDAFTVKKKVFPESLHHMTSKGGWNPSPARSNHSPAKASLPYTSSQLNKFRDAPDDEIESFFGECDDELPTLKLFGGRGNKERKSLASFLTPITPPSLDPTPRASLSGVAEDDFENDFEFPLDTPLQLRGVKGGERLRLPDHGLDFGFEDWGDGDSGLGSSYAGTRGGTDRGHGGSHSVISPSISAMTIESEDDMPLEGLILPDGVLPDFYSVLERRRLAATPTDPPPNFHAQKDSDDPGNEEFFEGIEIGDGEVFDSKKLSLNRNVRQKQPARKPSPIRRTAMSLTFTTNKIITHQPPSRLSRPNQNNPATLLPSAPLEPVAERENHPSTTRHSGRSRWSGDPALAEYRFSNESRSIPPPPPVPQSRQRNLGPKSPRNMRGENVSPTTIHAQLVRAKRSIPNIKDIQAQSRIARPPSQASNKRPSSRSSTGRPPSSGTQSVRPPSSGGRPSSRTSSGRPQSRNETQSSRNKSIHGISAIVRHPAPFLPGGNSLKNSQHITAKASKQCLDGRDSARPISRIQNRTSTHSHSSSGASNTTKKGPSVAPEGLRREAASFASLTQPTRKRNFGDGTELEIFDDLPTSAKVENRYTVAPVARAIQKPTRQKSGLCREIGDSLKKKKQENDVPRQEDIPRFARDTNASRKAREYTQQRLGLMASPSPSPNADRWRSKIAARNHSAPKVHERKNSQQKPHLIKPMGSINTLPKENATNGMTYNPRTFRWEGNDRDLKAFELPDVRTPPRPALITKVNQSGSKMGIQVVGGMVFDPSRMCWLKVDEDPEDEGDPFEGLDDLPEDLMSVDGQSIAGVQTRTNSVVMGGVGSAFGGGIARISGGFGEFVVGEEFDVGPEFERRQREEEDKWRKLTHGWISAELASDWNSRYKMRDVLADYR